MLPDHPFRDYLGRRVTVLGLGSFGGGVGAVRFLVDRGAQVTISDARPAEQLAESLAELDGLPVERHMGENDPADVTGAELVVVNPAIKRDHPLLKAAAAAGVPLTSEMNLFWQHNRGRVAAVTGSNGKSTTTALLHNILRQGPGRAWLGGNIGRSLLPDVDQIAPDDWVVLELSSFQLTDLDRLQVSPEVSVVTNFSPNHLDWHPSLDHYRWAKQTLLRWQTATSAAVLNADDPGVANWPSPGRRAWFGLTDVGRSGAFATAGGCVVRDEAGEVTWPLGDWLTLPGRHNVANALGAIAAARACGATREMVEAGIRSYEPLPHRLQFVGEVRGVKFYNDSLATTPESAEVALEAFDQPIVLLAGGYDKHVDLSGMARAIARKAKAVALLGQTGPLIGELVRQTEGTHCQVSPPQPDFPTAFIWAVSAAGPGDVVVLSPGCASYDWFRNFADRGRRFEELVRGQLSVVSGEEGKSRVSDGIGAASAGDN